MNNVRWFDQYRTTTTTVREEKRVTIAVSKFLIDAAVTYMHTLLKVIAERRHLIPKSIEM